MVCTYCGAETKVINSRHQKRNNQVWRRRHCDQCKAIFTSHEKADLSSILIILDREEHKPFLEDILFVDILNALSHRKDRFMASREVTATVVNELIKLPQKPLIKSSQISFSAAGVLKRLDRQAWLRYVAEHASLHQR